MRIILLVIILVTFHSNLLAESIMAENENSRTDTSIGVVHITNFNIGEILLYERPDSQPIDTLKFELKNYAHHWWRKKMYYTVSLQSGSTLSPYTLVHGEIAMGLAQQQATNIKRIAKSKNKWVQSHMQPRFRPIYDISFKVINDYGDWICIILNDETNEMAYIRRNYSYMSFSKWEDFISSARTVLFANQNAYDSKNGQKIELEEELKRGRIVLVDGNWMNIRYYQEAGEAYCWIRWKDETGMLLKSTDIINREELIM